MDPPADRRGDAEHKETKLIVHLKFVILAFCLDPQIPLLIGLSAIFLA